jgi:hypothetical protein
MRFVVWPPVWQRLASVTFQQWNDEGLYVALAPKITLIVIIFELCYHNNPLNGEPFAFAFVINCCHYTLVHPNDVLFATYLLNKRWISKIIHIDEIIQTYIAIICPNLSLCWYHVPSIPSQHSIRQSTEYASYFHFRLGRNIWVVICNLQQQSNIVVYRSSTGVCTVNW